MKFSDVTIDTNDRRYREVSLIEDTTRVSEILQVYQRYIVIVRISQLYRDHGPEITTPYRGVKMLAKMHPRGSQWRQQWQAEKN